MCAFQLRQMFLVMKSYWPGQFSAKRIGAQGAILEGHNIGLASSGAPNIRPMCRMQLPEPIYSAPVIIGLSQADNWAFSYLEITNNICIFYLSLTANEFLGEQGASSWPSSA